MALLVNFNADVGTYQITETARRATIFANKNNRVISGPVEVFGDLEAFFGADFDAEATPLAFIGINEYRSHVTNYS
jgi:hypothetical protein